MNGGIGFPADEWFGMTMMKLQTTWHQGSLVVWDEHAASAAQLRAVIGELSSDALLASVAGEGMLRVWVPGGVGADAGRGAETVGPVVQPSGSDVQPRSAQPPASSGRWHTEQEVPVLRFAGAQAIDFLASLPEPLPGECGQSIQYWRRLGTFVTDRIAQRQFYPDIEPGEGATLRGAWRLLVSGSEEVGFLERFAAAMPPGCRAIVGATQGAVEPARMVESFLGVTTDALIRRAVSEDPFFQQPHTRAAEPDSGGELRWLAALLGSDRTVHGDSQSQAMLVEQVRGWVGRLEDDRLVSLVRLCFRLEEPVEENEAWRVALLLQVLEGDGTLIDAEAVWTHGAEPTGIVGRNVLDRRAQLMSQLGRAAEVWPMLDGLLGQPAPAHVQLTAAEAHAFIHQWGPRLRESGFGTLLPAWATQPQRELAIQLAVRPTEEMPLYLAPGEGKQQSSWGRDGSSVSGQFGLDSLLQFDWQVAVGDLQLTADDLRALVAHQSPLVRYQDQWVQIDAEAAQRAMDFLERGRNGRMTLAEAMRTAFGAGAGETGLPIKGLVGSSWIGQLLQQAPPSQYQNLAQPAGFDGTLRAYQLRGLEWLVFLDRLAIGACLADDMGLGKTIQLIALLLHERAGRTPQGAVDAPPAEPSGLQPPASSPVGPTLLFAPTSVVGNWVREVQRFAKSLRVLVHHGPDRLSGDAFVAAVQEHDLVLTSYALAYRDLEDLRRPPWHRIVLDEAQKIKNPSAASTLAIRSLYAPRRVALTGTPVENHLSELWSIMEILNPGLLGPAGEFRERFAVPIEKLADRARAEHLRQMIRPFLLRRTKADPQVAGDLPEKMEMRVYCNLTPEQAGIYQRITDEMLGRIDSSSGIRRRGLILAALTRLKQVCDHPALLSDDKRDLEGRSGKCERLVEMLEEVLEEGEAALVFTQYRQMGHLLEKLLPQRLRIPVQFLHGGTPAAQRDAMVQKFQDPAGGVRVFILSLRAGGLGLNLTAANHVFHFDRWWNPAVENQATDRAHRIGQSRKVQVHKYVCIGTMEERIDRMLSDKMALADSVVPAGEEWLTNLSTDDLRRTLALSADAVGEF